jgi:hypothetical protein
MEQSNVICPAPPSNPGSAAGVRVCKAASGRHYGVADGRSLLERSTLLG